MANASLKKDFKNGDKLYDYQLNNNFAAIEAALATMNKIIWQDSDDATGISGFRGTAEEIEDRELIDGQLLYNTETGETYIDCYVDDVLTRINTGSGNVIAIQSEEPTNDAVKLWIDTDTLDVKGTEITNTYSERTDVGYSANYTNTLIHDAIEEVYSTSELKTNKVWIDNKPIYRKCFEFTNPTSSAKLHNISNLGDITSINGSCLLSNGKKQPVPRVVYDDAGFNIGIGDITNTSFTIQYGDSYVSDFTITKMKLIFEYTKTTD